MNVLQALFCVLFHEARALAILFLNEAHAERTSVFTALVSVFAYAEASAADRAVYADDTALCSVAIPDAIAVSRAAAAVPTQATSTFALLRNSVFCARVPALSEVVLVPVSACAVPANASPATTIPMVRNLIIRVCILLIASKRIVIVQHALRVFCIKI